MHKNLDLEKKLISRRGFIKDIGKSVAGVAIASTGLSLLTGCTNSAAKLPEKEDLNFVYAEARKDKVEYPFTYQKLDVATATERGYRGYYDIGGCCRGVADAIIGQLADSTGYPFNQIPIDMFANGTTGYGTGTLCGSLGGAVAAIGLVCTPEDSVAITKELFSWYRKAELPIYQPDHKLDKTVANSVNCDESVTTYMSKAGISDMKDDKRRARCAGVTGDVAAKTVELLNKHFNV